MGPTTRRWLLAGGLFLGAGLGLAAYDAATHQAHAADRTPHVVAERPGGALGHQLPTQASDRAKQVHALLADTPAEPPCPDPAETPADEPEQQPDPAPADPPKPAPADDEPAQQPTEEPAPEPAPEPDPVVEVPPVSEPVPPGWDETVPVADDTKPLPTERDPIVIALPTGDPAPLPDTGGILDPILDTATSQPPTPATLPTEPPATVLAAPTDGNAPDCTNQDATHIDGDLIGQLIDSLTAPTTATTRTPQPREHCHSTPHRPTSDATTSPHTSSSWNADTTARLAAPALGRLQHARARSAIPTGRHVAIEPGPA